MAKAYSKVWSFREEALLTLYQQLVDAPTGTPKEDLRGLLRAAVFLTRRSLRDIVTPVSPSAFRNALTPGPWPSDTRTGLNTPLSSSEPAGAWAPGHPGQGRGVTVELTDSERPPGECPGVHRHLHGSFPRLGGSVPGHEVLSAWHQEVRTRVSAHEDP